MVTPNSTWVPDRGDIAWIDLNPVRGHEQAGRRPVIVLSPAAYNGRVGLMLACPITSHIKGYPFEVVLPEGLPISGAVLADQVRSVDWRGRYAEPASRLPPALLNDVTSRIAALLL